MKTTLTATALMLFTGLLSHADVAAAASFYGVEGLASRFQGQTVGLVRELQWGYRDAPQYKHLYADAAGMYKLAGHVNELVYQNADPKHIAADVTKLDGLFHHVEKLVDEMSVKIEADLKNKNGVDAPAAFGPAPYGSCRGPNCNIGAGPLKWRLDAMQRTLHYLLDEMKPYQVAPVSNVIQPAKNIEIPLDVVEPQDELQPLIDVQPADTIQQ